jgi:type IV secretory pathway VirB10-like protein
MRRMTFAVRVILALLLIFLCLDRARAQGPSQIPSQTTDPVIQQRPVFNPAPSHTENIPLTVPKGTPVQIALDDEVRVRKVGQPIRGHVVDPVYAFDRIVIPVGTEVTGQITGIEPISGGKRTLEALNADFTPLRRIHVEFTELVLGDGKHIQVHTAVTPGSGQLIQFVSAANESENKKGVKDAASEKIQQAKAQAKQEWDSAMQQVKKPGKMHRVERYAIAQLPVHPQYIDAGTVYFAELQDPLDFGTESLTPEAASSLGSELPSSSFVHALLMTPLDSATSQKGDDVEAVLSQPLFDGKNLILPQGSRFKGSVVQVQPARYMSRNGQLRVVFHELIPPDGPAGAVVAQKVDASLEGVQSGKAENVKLDSEGGAEATTPKTRYLTTGISVGLAMMSFGRDQDAPAGNVAGNTSNRVAGGAGGFKLVGIALGLLVHSRVLGYSMGAYGACMSIYVHFVARGRDVVFPKNTIMQIGIGTRPTSPEKPTKPAA